MNSPERVIRGQRVVLPDRVAPAAIAICNGVITAITDYHQDFGSTPVIDAGNDVLMPGLVDTHVHVNEPGRTEWEGYQTATRAAAAGGITTLVDMPLNSIPATTSLAALEHKRAAAAGQCAIDVGFWGGVVPGNHQELVAMVDAGVMGFKCFLVDSGVPEFGCVDEPEARRALGILAETGVPLLVHAEVPGPIDAAAKALASADPRRYLTYLASRPPEAEEQAIALMLGLSRDTGAAVHIVHHAAASALPLLVRARDEGLRLTAETCPHYLHFAAEDIADGATEYKCAPPIRERQNREQLWQALGAGTLAMVVSDHSPCTVALKGKDAGDFMAAWGGVAGLQLTLPVTWTGASSRGFGVLELSRWMCEAPARLAGLDGTKGALRVGCDADFLIWDPDAELEVDVTRLAHKNKITPYHGERLRGVVKATYVRGELVFDGNGPVGDPRGRLLTRKSS